jgi:hypothetical protein
LKDQSFDIARRGLGTAFTESQVPKEYALRFTNRTINAAGGAEKRPGMDSHGDLVSGMPTLTNGHEYLTKDDTSVLFYSGQGNIYKEVTTSARDVVYSFADANARIRSVQFDDKLIFWNGTARAIYTDDEGETFQELQAIIEEGSTSTGTDTTHLVDADVSGAGWPDLNVVVNDIVFNLACSGFGIITAVTSATITHTEISPTAEGIGGPGGTQIPGQNYRILDSVELNIIKTNGIDDNVATAVSATGNAFISVSADKVADWTKTELRIGDWVHNTTRSALTIVTAISTAQIGVVGISGQAAGDSLTFHKSALPIPHWMHVHYSRLYVSDARNRKRILISGAADPQDFTVDSSTLESVTLNIGTQQPTGDAVVAINSFQSFLVIGTGKNVLAYRGTSPADLEPAGLFPIGVVSPDAFINTGNDLAFLAPDGLFSVSLLVNTNNLQRSNLSEPIKTDLRGLIRDTDPSDIAAVNYQRRSWLLCKIGSQIFCYNYSNFVLDDGRLVAGASWSQFDGLFCTQNAYFVNRNQDLYCVGAGGVVYRYDTGTFDDAGTVFHTEYQTGWLTPFEGKGSQRMKTGKYIAPTLEAGGSSVYTIEAVGSFDAEAVDSIVVSAETFGAPIGTAVIGGAIIGAARATAPKLPLRWRGSEVRITFSTQDDKGPDVLSSFSLYGDILGRR